MPYFQRPSLQVVPRGIVPADSATDIVQQAIGVLERERTAETATPPASVSLADGLPVKTDRLEARADQLRRQASDLVEGLLSLVLSSGSGGGRMDQGLTDSPGPLRIAGCSGAAPSLTPAQPAFAGDVVRVPFMVVNQGGQPVDVSFYGSDLVGDSGFGIPARKVVITPRSQPLQAQERGAFEVSVPVPPQTPPGVYAGIIQAVGLDGLRAVLSVPVK